MHAELPATEILDAVALDDLARRMAESPEFGGASATDAEDVVQEAFARLAASVDTVEDVRDGS